MTKKTNQLTAGQFDKLFPNEEACDNYLIANRWPKGVHCPRCGSEDTELLSEFGSTPCKALHRCRACLEPFDRFKCI